ncbi:reversion-inducing-cysteine-rich protein with kazal motifs isoform X2 [Rhodnius prolixus]|uniref:reversion-inducing-cysteine-rich protein with kazal motifs isoform X2 n=1 Tax=Rhodnius prolixus TaxID=13249 RepID=UPI003D18BC78
MVELQVLVPFWRCMNDTEKNEDRKSWRICCNKAQTERCHRACRSAATSSELPHHCRHSDELDLFACVQKLQEGEECCGLARNPECHNLCRKWLQNPSHVSRSYLVNACSYPVVNCINNISKPAHLSAPHKYLHCCDKASDPKCKEACKKILKTRSSTDDVADAFGDAGCPLTLQDKVSQCFLHNDQDTNPRNLEKPQKVGADAAKLHCCSKAVTQQCKRLCHKTFTNEWNPSWQTFDNECLTPAEDNLSQCIDEVEEPCEVGCEGLSYCSNFNNRPTELFRSCDINADKAAKENVVSWMQKGSISVPNIKNLFIKNIAECSPITWQTIACTLQIRPCQRSTQVTRICKEDCFKVLSVCLDWSRMSQTVSAADVCSELAPSDPSAPCISLNPFLTPSEEGYTEAITKPCLPDPCSPSELCTVARNCAPSDVHCRPYRCLPGCKLGDLSPLTVPAGSYARIPTSVGQKGCHKICECTLQGTMSRCQSLSCVPQDYCQIGKDRIEHGSTFFMECNACSCYAGEIICSKRQCPKSSLSITDITETTFPCNCPPHYIPVCGWNGVTYPSSCFAKCVGMADGDYMPGTCSSINPCYENPCSENEICVIKRRVCLPSLERICPQFVCVNKLSPCSHQADNGVCSTSGQFEPNPCSLLVHRQLELAYFGQCLLDCSNEGSVCGIDGNTYMSECQAHARLIAVDYTGPCITVGLINSEPKKQCSNSVKCPPLAEAGCLGVTPPGACCPICTGALKVLFSQKQIDRTVNSMDSELADSFLVESIMKALNRQVQVAECTVRGYLTVETDLLVLVTTTKKNPSSIQLGACIVEAEKIAVLIQRSSPRIVSELSLSALTAATIVHQPVNSSAFAQLPTFTVIGSLILLVWISSNNR